MQELFFVLFAELYTNNYSSSLTEIYIHLKDVLKQLSQAPIDEEFSDDQLLKHMLVSINVFTELYFYWL
jgi:hypothetical protein